MLKKLLIKNYALIDEVEIDFQGGLNIITGETGSGKSIIMDSLNLILGERANNDVIRKNEQKAVVEAYFDITDNKKIKKIIENANIDCFDELILRREINLKGQNRSFINDTPSSLASLKEIGDSLMDLHGQHEHQSLLRAESHIDMVDEYGNLQSLINDYQNSYKNLSELFKQLNNLIEEEKNLKEKMSLYEFQIKEIDEIDPKENEIEKIEAELAILENYEVLHESTNTLHQLFYSNENSIRDQLIFCLNKLQELSNIDKSFLDSFSEIKNAEIIIEEVNRFIKDYNSKVEFDPARLEELRKRIINLNKLKKKYGGSLKAVIEHRETIGKEYSLAENFEFEIEKIQKQIKKEQTLSSEKALKLSNKRKEVSKKIEKAIITTLQELGIEKASFEIRFEKKQKESNKNIFVILDGKNYESTSKGFDIVEFFISLNIGEELKPLVKVASGGEISRIMLALKSILAKSDKLPGLAFDEIDVGVSGRIAQKVGQCLKNLAGYHQILAITHLPQIAGLADVHFVVEKTSNNKHSSTTIRKLTTNKERINEVAKLISGETITDNALASAKELMGL